MSTHPISARNLVILSAPPVVSHGWGRYTRDLIAVLAGRGCAITLITSHDAPADPQLPLVGYHRLLPSVIHAPRFLTARLLLAVPRIRHLSATADAVYVFAEPYTLAAALIRPPRTITAHGTYVARSLQRQGVARLVSRLYRAVYERSHIVCVSHYTAHTVSAVLPTVSTEVILNGVDVTRFRQKVPHPDKAGLTVLAVGQVKERKGFHVLVAALSALRAYIPNVQGVFIGDLDDAAYVGALRAQISAAGLGDSVRVLGRVDEPTLIGWYQTADVFALPALNVGGKFEGFGLVYLEASSAGLPTIGSHDCGAEDAILDGQTGLLIAQNDVPALTSALRRLLGDEALRQAMGTAGRVYAEGQTWDAVAARWLAR